MSDKERVRKIIKIAALALCAVLFIVLIVYLAVIGARKPSFPKVNLATTGETAPEEATLPPDSVVVEKKTVLNSGVEYAADLNDNGFYELISVNKRNLEYRPDIATVYINRREVFQGDHVKEVVIENPFGWERGWLIGIATYDDDVPEGYLRYRLYEYQEGDFFPINCDLERLEGIGGEAIPIIAAADQVISNTPTFTRNETSYDMLLDLGLPEVFYVHISAEDIDPLSFYIQTPREGQSVYLHYASSEWPTLKSTRVERRLKSFQATYDKADITGNRRILPIGQRYQIVKILFPDDISTDPSEWNGQQVWFQLGLDDGTFVYILAQNLWRDMQTEETPTTEAGDGTEAGSEDASNDASNDASAEENGTGDDVSVDGTSEELTEADLVSVEGGSDVVSEEPTADPNALN